MTFKEVGKELPEQWKPTEKGDFLQGIYAQKKENVGENNANLYIIEKEGKLYSAWGSTVLDDKMIYVKIGDLIRITYQGKVKKYHDYTVEKDVRDDGESPDPVEDAVEEAEETTQE